MDESTTEMRKFGKGWARLGSQLVWIRGTEFKVATAQLGATFFAKLDISEWSPVMGSWKHRGGVTREG